jgi:hypothetical protein
LDTTDLHDGNHSINVRAVSGAPFSLTHTVDINIENGPSKEEQFIAGQFSTAIIVLLVLVVAVLAYLYYKKRKNK